MWTVLLYEWTNMVDLYKPMAQRILLLKTLSLIHFGYFLGVSKIEAKVSMRFGNRFQNGNGFHFVKIQFQIDLETFFGLVSNSNGNSFHFGNMFPNQLDTCFHYGYFLWLSILD